MTERLIRAGFARLGGIARVHAPVLRDHQKVQLVGGVDRVPAQRQRLRLAVGSEEER